MSNELQWTPEEIQDAVDELVKDLEAGEYDLHLRTIARAVFSRRDAIKGTSTVIPDPPSPNVQKAIGNGNTVVTPSYPPVPNLPATAGVPMLTTVTPLSKGTRLRTGQNALYFNYQGRRFPKSSVRGMHFRFANNVRPEYLRNVLVKIHGVGDKALQCTIAEEPQRKGKYHQYWVTQEKFFLSLKLIDQYLDVGAP